MALEGLLVNPANMMSAFSPYSDVSASPSSPGLSAGQTFSRNSSDSLRPEAIERLSHHVTSPSDMVGPSPVTSNGTETTEIEDEESDEVVRMRADSSAASTSGSVSTLTSLTTALPAQYRSSLEDEPSSVIHAPEGYGSFANTKNPNPAQTPPNIDRSTPKPYSSDLHSDLESSRPSSPPPISTNVAPTKFGLDNSTPRAQTRQELESYASEKARLRSSSASSLEGIPESQLEDDDAPEEALALKAALHECWTLCNTLASLSSIHRERIFSFSGTGDAHEKAWKCCWRLCQQLYDSRDEEEENEVLPTLDLCRDFCQALFDVRDRDNELADSVLRVSFELNNHLYNTRDRNLPEAFRERTLDFYITLCHRLMKQRTELAEETHSLLRACWALAEMLFSLRQNRKDGKPADEELLGSAVQACWELCDLFRKGWTQVRPDRGTPRPSQTTFSQSFETLSRSSHNTTSSISSLHSVIEHTEPQPMYMPETPTTEFEDTPISPDEHSPSIPNILVLGTEQSRSNQARWSSSASNLSGYSQGSNKTSSTITKQTGPEDANLTRLKVLILKAAMNSGFTRPNPSTSISGTSTALSLQAFVKSLPTGSFGSLPWHASLLTAYKNLVLSDPTFRSTTSLPAKGKKASAIDVAKSVTWMMQSGQYTFLKDLFRLVFGFHIEESDSRKHVSISPPLHLIMSDFDHIPILDLAQAQVARADFLRDLRHAVLDVGFLYITNVGISEELFRDVVTEGRAFFHLPTDEKLKIEMRQAPSFLGYSQLGAEITKHAVDHREQIDLSTEHPVRAPDQPLYYNLLAPNQWPSPDYLPRFRDVFTTYMRQMADVSMRFTALLAEAIDLPPDAFDRFFDADQQHKLKIIKYPDAADLGPAGASLQGVGPHKDSMLTSYLLQASPHRGLQVQNARGAWVDVPPLPNTLVVAIGQGMEALTRGVCRSTTHRVLSPAAGAGPRFSIPFFQGVSLDASFDGVEVPPHMLDLRAAARANEAWADDVEFTFSSDRYACLGQATLMNRIKSHPDVGERWYPDLLRQLREAATRGEA